ncbi:MAG: alpha-glucoside transport system substrate-binding protein [Actinomycetota bacterium]|nr:alpha-glucoside transport system substrate-binding protein [Actinomycetota bacterium]
MPGSVLVSDQETQSIDDRLTPLPLVTKHGAERLTAYENLVRAVPATWAELTEITELSREIAASGTAPRRDGFNSGNDARWEGTDRVEDGLLHLSVGEVYDKWVAHEIPFNDPRVAAAMDWAGDVFYLPPVDPSVLGAFWAGVLGWVNGKSTREVLDAIDAAWPTS